MPIDVEDANNAGERSTEEEEEEVEEEVKAEPPRRSTRSMVTKADDASSRRRRSVEPIRYSQLQEEDRAIAKIKFEQQTLLRKGEKRRLDPKASGGGGSSKRTRAEERRTARQARRRDARSPTLPSSLADEDENAWRALPAMALDGSGAQSKRFTKAEDAVIATVCHSTSWRRVHVSSSPPSNLLPTALLEPFAVACDQPLGAYDDELARQCRVLRPAAFLRRSPLAERTSAEELRAKVHTLLADATPLAKRCHAARVAHVLAATRQSVRACLAQLPARREAIRAAMSATAQSLPLPKLQRVTTATLLETQREHDPEALPTYFVGRGEGSSVRERGVLPKEMVRLRQLPWLSRSTTCIGVRVTMPVDDDPIIRYVPFFSQATKADAQLAQLDANKNAVLSALDDEVNEYVLRFVVAATDGDARVFASLRELAWCLQPQTDYASLQQRDARQRVVALQQKARGGAGAGAGAGGEGEGCTSSLKLRLDCKRGEATETRRQLGVWSADSLLDGFRALFCRRCYVYNCQFHGVHQPVPSTRIDPVHPSVKKSLRHLFATEEYDETIEETDTLERERQQAEPTDPTKHDVVVVTEEERIAETVVAVPAADDAMAEVRRSVRSGTAMVTKASEVLLHQTNKPRRRHHNGTARSKKRNLLADPSEYFELDATYRKVTAAARAVLLQSQDGDGQVCSESCHWAHPPASGARRLGVEEKLHLALAERRVGPNPCVIARLLPSTTCAEIYAQLANAANTAKINANSSDENQLVATQNELRALLAHGGAKHDHNRDHIASVRGNTREHLTRTRSQRMKDRGSNHQFVPCHHAGESSCNSNGCSCMRRDHFCETSCGCPLDCANRFPGCRCARSECGSAECPCYFAGRECDPDVCGSCGACEIPLLALDPASRATPSKALRVCGNTNILRGAHRKIGMAASTTHGWGAFALEEVGAGEFIYEYTGELLTQDEAERRGNVYDRNAVSFLFDLNEDAVVDAARKGNKSKFANHSSLTPNCAARIMLVKGDHRIGLYAKRTIAAGEELFFDYGHHGVVPDWSQSRIRSAAPKSAPVTQPGGPSSGDESSAPSSPRRGAVEVEDQSEAEEEEEDKEEEKADHKSDAMEVDQGQDQDAAGEVEAAGDLDVTMVQAD